MIATRQYRNSSSFKMALLFTILLGIAVIIISYFGYYFSRNNFIKATEAIIDTEIRYLANEPYDRILSVVDYSIPDRIYFLADTNNKKISGNLDNFPTNVVVLKEGTILFEFKKQKYAAKIMTLGNGNRLLIGIDITKAQYDDRIMLILSIISIGLMSMVILTSFLISSFVVGRTRYIAKIAHGIMETGDLSQRIDVTSHWDDLSYLAQVLNALLARVEALMQNVRQVSDNIAHDLRTPLTRLRNKLETLYQRLELQQDQEMMLACETLQSEADHLLDMFNALLRIARIESGQQKKDFKAVQIAHILHDVIEFYEPLAEQKHIKIKYALSEITCDGDRDLLFQAFANILDNAIKFTPVNGDIDIQLKDHELIVIDSGPGILDHEKTHVFKRFYRSETSRHSPGSGLGLSLVAAVFTLHGAEILLQDAHPGLKIRIKWKDNITII